MSAECRELKSYEQNRKRAFEKLGEKIQQYHENLLWKEVFISKETVRTYHEQDNRVTDHKSGLKQAYTDVAHDVSDMVAARIKACQSEEVMR